MERIKIDKDIYLYRFEKALGHFVGLNTVVIENGNEALLIDTGYEENFLELKEDLDRRGLNVTHVVVSHFHPDHIGGLKYLSDVEIYGSIFAKHSLEKFNDIFDHILPNNVIVEEKTLIFGGHIIKMEKNVGHSKDGILITIDNKFMYVGDDMVFSHDGKALIPFCADQIVDNHVLSILKIYNQYKGKTIIPTHGMIMEDQKIIEQDLKNRLIYLNYIIEYPDCTFKEFIEETGIRFIGMKSHVYNTNKEVKQW
ncbi:MAG: Hydroxyacylglutathione hydrolase [Candidatus Izimaplasma bacterium HR2]|nr:MAG: Hydroxyacylglutathione hydrolase [Candidatus Izimaplasma bacterium HR2]